MITTTQRLSWFSSLTTAAILGLTSLLSGCGGGGAASSTPVLPTIVPAAAVVYAYADAPTVLTIRDGKKPFNVYSSNSAIISFNPATMPGGQVADESIVLEGPAGNYGRVSNVNADTPVTLTVRDANGAQVDAVVTVKPSSLNNTLTITGSANGTVCTGGAGVLCSGGQATASVTAQTVTGGPLTGHKVRFRVMDQGAKYGFVCNQSLGDCLSIETDSTGHIITLETTTDVNGNAYAVIKADVNAPTQYATISATDQVSGHVLRKQFAIAGNALSSLGSGTWTITLPTVTVTCTAVDTPVVGCTGAGTPAVATYKTCPSTVVYSSYFVYGGTPPYSVSSTSPLVGGVILPPLTATSYPVTFPTQPVTVNSTGDSFLVVWPCTPQATPTLGSSPAVASGTVNLLVIDGTGLPLTPAPTFQVTVN